MDSKIEFNELCRLCLAKNHVGIPIFEGEGHDEVFLKISTCLPVNISYEDKLPKRICTNCLNKLNILYKFCNKSANSEKQLLDWFNQYGTENETSIDSNVDYEMAQSDSEIEIKEEVLSFLTDEDDNIKIEDTDIENYNILQDISKQGNEISNEQCSDTIGFNAVTNGTEVEVKQENDDDDDEKSKTTNLQAEVNTKYAKKMSPSSKKTQKVRQLWDKESMKNAICAVRENKMGFLKASKHFQVPRSTLRRLTKLQDIPLDVLTSRKLGRKAALTSELEESLKNYILTMQSKFFGLTKLDIMSLAYQMVVRNNITNPFSAVKETAGRDWLRLFLKRHPKLSFIRSAGTAFTRSKGFNKENVGHFFSLLEDLMERHHFTANNIYNVDETGIFIVPSKVPVVLSLKGKKQIGALTSVEKDSLITCIVCMSAAGNFVPPMLIFPRKRTHPLLMKGAPPGCICACHPSGWVQTNLFTTWFKHFIHISKPSVTSPVLLILDGHVSHTTNIDLIDLARDNHVHLLSTPPQSSHKIRPLDKTFMEPLQSYLSEEIRFWIRNNPRASLTHFNITELFGRSYLKAHRSEIVTNGFKSTGIYPFNRNVFRDEDFTAADNIAVVHRNESKQAESVDNHNSEVISNESLLGNYSTAVNKLSPSSSTIEEAYSEVCSLPCTSVSVTSSSDLITPYEIYPAPIKITRRSSRDRETGKDTIITSSSYKRKFELEEKAKSREKINKASKNLKFNKSKGKVLQKKRKQDEISDCSTETDDDFILNDSLDESPDRTHESDAICLYCDGLFSKDIGGKKWTQCLSCELWAHVDCSGAECDVHLCEFCIHK